MPATDWKEQIPDDEAARFERHAEALARMQRAARKQEPLDRALHAKANLGLEAQLVVPPDLPAEVRVGMFATPRTYQAVVRFSNGANRRQSDRVPDVRGIAVKVFGVDGKKVIPGMEDARTQDFLAIRTSSLSVRDIEEFMTLVTSASSPALLPFRLAWRHGLGRAVSIVRRTLAGIKAPQPPLAATPYFSGAPISFGASAVQFAFSPQWTAPPAKIATATQLGDELTERLRTTPVSYDMRVRFYVDPTRTPIEDATVEWDSPWVTVATLVLPVQDVASPRGQAIAAFVEQLAFDPWHARTDLRSLGNIMRARNVAYRASTQARGARAEPTELPTF